MIDLTHSSLSQFINENLGFSSQKDVKSSLEKAEKFEEIKQIKETEIVLRLPNSQKKESNCSGIS